MNWWQWVPTSIKRSFFWPGVVEEPRDVPKRPLFRRESEVEEDGAVAEGTVIDTDGVGVGVGAGAGAGVGAGAGAGAGAATCVSSAVGGIRFFRDSSRLFK